MDQEAAFREVQRLGLEVETTERVVKDRWVWILGTKLDADDLYECLQEVQDNGSHIHLSDETMVEVLKEIGVISGTSRSWGTHIESQEKLDQLLTMVREALGKVDR